MRLLLILLLALIPGTATAGIRATFGVDMGAPILVEIADNGDISAELGNGRRLLVLAGEDYLVVDRLTGPLVMRPADLRVAAAERPRSWRDPSPGSNERFIPRFVERGTAEVQDRTGRAWFLNLPEDGRPAQPIAVLSSDPALAPLSRALARMIAADAALAAIEQPGMEGDSVLTSMAPLLDQGAPLRFGIWTLRSVEHVAMPPERFTLPAPVETRDAMRARMAAEAAEDDNGGSRDTMIAHAEFANGRLWLVNDGGSLTSLAEGETARTAHHPGAPVLSICRSGPSLLALTRSANRWTLRRLDSGTWNIVREIDAAGDTFVAMACGEAGEMILTNHRLIDLAPGGRSLALRGELGRGRTTLHVTPEAVYAGFNAGEWGGGLSRIDRRTGAVTAIESNTTGELCGGPLNTQCNPVNGLAALPWRRDCVAAAIGLIHMMAHGRIVSICPDSRVEQIFVGLGEVDPDDARAMAEARTGGYGSVAFYGLARAGDGLIAAGHNGLYRLTEAGGTHMPWPRFAEVDGILVSFALPDVVLVMSELNRRASVSGLSPILVVR